MYISYQSDELIKKVESNGLYYSINKEEKTSSVVGITASINEVIVPRSIIYETTEYIVTKIGKKAFYCSRIKSLQFAPDSQVQIIEEDAFNSSKIESLSIPSSLVELNENWCNSTKKIVHINVMQNNPYFKLYEDKYIIKKSSIEKENYDVLVFCVRNIIEAIIPNFIEIIESYSFSECSELIKVEFEKDSKLRVIKKEAFSWSQIESISIPPSVIKIDKFAFFFCTNLQKFDVPNNSKLQKISREVFYKSQIESLSIPSSLIELKKGWCCSASKLNKIIVSSENPHYSLYQNMYIVGKSSIEQENYDVLVFCIRNIQKAIIPSFIEIIGPYAFSECSKLKVFEFERNSKLRIIDQNAFLESSINEISLPHNIIQINANAFSYCTKLTSIEIPSNSELKIIENEAFLCTNMKSFVFPCHISKIVDHTFTGCTNLQIVEFSENIEICEESAFFNCFMLCIIMIPAQLKGLFRGLILNIFRY